MARLWGRWRLLLGECPNFGGCRLCLRFQRGLLGRDPCERSDKGRKAVGRRVGGCSPRCVEPGEFSGVSGVEVVDCCDGGLCWVLPEPCCGVDLAVPVKGRGDPFPPPPPPARGHFVRLLLCALSGSLYRCGKSSYDPTYTGTTVSPLGSNSVVNFFVFCVALHLGLGDCTHSCRRLLLVLAYTVPTLCAASNAASSSFE